MIALARRLAVALAATTIAAVAAPAAHGTGPAAGRPCALGVHDEQLPGGTPAYAVTVAARRTSCAIARRVTQVFHRCRGEGHSRCRHRVLGRWSCTGARRGGVPLGLPVVFFGSVSCRSGAARVSGSYQENFPSCYGAASRDPEHACVNPTRAMVPALGEAGFYDQYEGSSGCDLAAVPGSCTFGASARAARRHFALIGDSHAFHWRAALALVAQVERWRGYSVTAGGCFYSTAAPSFSDACESYNEVVVAFLARHPEVDTVFETSNADTPVGLPPGVSNEDFKIDGFLRAWAQLPRTVRHVVVLRDTPASSERTFACLARASAAGERPGTTCALARSIAIRDDLAAAAAGRPGTPSYESIDLTHYFCGSRSCYPVIAGVRVNADIFGHLTPMYMRTVGPYLLRAVRRLVARW